MAWAWPRSSAANAAVSAGGIDKADDRAVEFFRQLHLAQRLAVAFRMGGAEIALDLFFGVMAPVPMAITVTGMSLSMAMPATIALSSAKRRSPCSSVKSVKDVLDKIAAGGTALGAGSADAFICFHSAPPLSHLSQRLCSASSVAEISLLLERLTTMSSTKPFSSKNSARWNPSRAAFAGWSVR